MSKKQFAIGNWQKGIGNWQLAKTVIGTKFKIEDMGYRKINETRVYKMAFDVAMRLFEISKGFPKVETYSLTDQIRRSSRSVCSCLAEAHRKRLYPAHFITKVSDADMENAETQTWLDFALACGYITRSLHEEMMELTCQVGNLLHHMITNPEKYK